MLTEGFHAQRHVALVVAEGAHGPRDVPGEPDPVHAGTIRSWRPCQMATGHGHAPRSNPQSARKATSSSCQPSGPPDPDDDRARAMKSAKIAGQGGLVDVGHETPERGGDIVGAHTV